MSGAIFKHLKVPIATETSRGSKEYKADPTILDNYLIKQACCKGMGGSSTATVEILLPYGKSRKIKSKKLTPEQLLEKGYYKPVPVTITADDCAKYAPGYHPSKQNNQNKKCDSFAKTYCWNAAWVNPGPGGDIPSVLRKGEPRLAPVPNLSVPGKPKPKWNPGYGHFCSCVLGNKSEGEVQCADIYCNEHKNLKAYKNEAMTHTCKYTICKQNVQLTDINAKGISIEDIDLAMSCGNVETAEQKAAKLKKKLEEEKLQKAKRAEAKAKAERERLEAEKRRRDKLAAEKKARDDAIAAAVEAERKKVAAEKKAREEALAQLRQQEADAQAAREAAAAAKKAAEDASRLAGSEEEIKAKEKVAAKALKGAKIAEEKKRIAEKNLRNLNKKKSQMKLYGAILLILIILIIAIVMLM